MRFKIKPLNKDEQDKFLTSTFHSPFLQSYGWSEFQEKIGNKTHRFGVFSNEYLVGVASAFQVRSKLNSYLYIPWGPTLNKWDKGVVEELLSNFKTIAEKENLDFVRLEPRVIGESEANKLVKIGLKKNQSFTQPECSAILDLSKSEEELMSALSDSTRYNIRNVERKGVKVRQGKREDVETFEKLLKETSERHKFTTDIHPDYYKNQFVTTNKAGMMDIFVAEFEGEPLAAALVIFFGDTTTYLHAASSRARPKLRAPYLLIWESILEGKRRGYKYFDFWGITPERAGKNHPWSGVTSFKMSFGGERVCYAPVFDLPTSNKYLFSKFIEISRKPIKKILRF